MFAPLPIKDIAAMVHLVLQKHQREGEKDQKSLLLHFNTTLPFDFYSKAYFQIVIFGRGRELFQAAGDN